MGLKGPLNSWLLDTLASEWIKWAAAWQNQQNAMCTRRRLRSAWASAQSDQSLCGCPGWSESSLCIQWVAKDPAFLHAAAKTLIRLGGWSDWVDAQADLSLRWARIHFVVFVVRRLKCPVTLQRILRWLNIEGLFWGIAVDLIKNWI